jgi:hypothetical protein
LIEGEGAIAGEGTTAGDAEAEEEGGRKKLSLLTINVGVA